MKYAIFSDIHGNSYALNAALSDAKAQGAVKYIFLGDYAVNFPWGNEVVETIRGMESAIVIRGNGEDYLDNLHGTAIQDMICEQFKPTYWAYQKLSADNLKYLISLPATNVINDGGEEIHLTHASDIFCRSQKMDFFHSGRLLKIMHTQFSRQEYLELARSNILSRPDALADIRALPKGVYLFGHNHLQFHMEFEGRLFINPGSCGEPLDWDTTAAYTLLERVDGQWTVTERRVEYDLDAVVDGFRISGFADYAPAWSEVTRLTLVSGKDYITPFFVHLIDTGRQLGQTEYPVSNEVWDIAIKAWDKDKV